MKRNCKIVKQAHMHILKNKDVILNKIQCMKNKKSNDFAAKNRNVIDNIALLK